MSVTWSFEQGGRWYGPFTGGQLKELAASGRLGSHALVRKGDDGKEVPAGQVKGLFADEANRDRPLPPPPSLPSAEQHHTRQRGSVVDRTRTAGVQRWGVYLGAGCLVALAGVVVSVKLIKVGGLAGPAPAEPVTTGTRPPVNDTPAPMAGWSAAPDFSGVNYQYDFTKDDYDTIPAGAKRQTRKQAVKEGDFAGRMQTEEGYIDSAGQFVPHGRIITWYDEAAGRMAHEGRALHGKPHGVFVSYYYKDTGERGAETPMVRGQPHGVERGWYRGDKPRLVVHYLEGKKHGLEQKWHENGQMMVEVAWVQGKRQGRCREWWEDGQPKLDCGYEEGVFHGPFMSQTDRYKSFDGVLAGYEEFRGQCEHGKPVGAWRLGFRSASKPSDVYYVSVADGTWRGGTREEFIAKMKFLTLTWNVQFQFGPREGIATFVTPTADEFCATFGAPDQDRLDPEKLHLPAHLRTRFWIYRCSNGTLTFKVQPTQDGKLLVTTR